MSHLSIDSDYTPKDFLQKLLGKPFTSEPVIEESEKPKAENSNSQSTIEDTLPSQPSEVFSPKSIYSKRIQFQSIQNIPGLDKRDIELTKYDSKASFEFKENLRKKSLGKQFAESHSTKNLYISSQNSLKSDPHESVGFQSVKNQHQISLETQQNLILQKTKLILKSLLKNRFQQSEIVSVLNSLENGIRNAEEFDKLVTSSNLESSLNVSNPKQNKKLEEKIIFRSKSVRVQERQSEVTLRRVKSCEKTRKQKLSKTQIKHIVQQNKQQILKAVKKMKQLVFLNEKSLKRTRRN